MCDHVCGSAKYQPYDALRQQFWRQSLKQYDADDTGALSHIELTCILNSLGSILPAETVNSFTRNGKKPVEDELTVDEAFRCLEMPVWRPPMRRRGSFPLKKGGRSLI
jgi:phosphatidylserine decarboxylase